VLEFQDGRIGDGLLDAFVKGDIKAFEKIYLFYSPKIIGFAIKKLRSKEIAEEIVQDVFIKLWIKRDLLQINNLEKYLYTTVKNAILDYYGALKVENKYLKFKKNSVSAHINFTEQAVIHHELTTVLEKSMLRLPEKSRKVFKMSRIENRSVKEIAVKMKLSEKSVEYHLTKSIKILRVLLKDYVLLALLFNLLP